MYAADRLPHVVIGRRGHRASVKHHQIRAGAFVGRVQALAGQQRFESGAIGLRSPAPKVLDEELPHYCQNTVIWRTARTECSFGLHSLA
jgi:hypothetical protein